MVFELMVEDVALVQEDQHHLSSSLDQSVILNSVYVQLSRGSKSFSCGPYNVTHAKCRKELNTKENELRTLQDYQPLLFKSTLYSRDLEPGNKKGLKSKKFSLNSKIPLIGRPGTSTATSNLDIGISLPIHFDPKIFKISILLDVQSLDSVEEKSVSASELVSAEINIADFAGRDGDVFHGEINLYPKSKVIKKKWMVSDSKFILKYSLTCGEPNSKYGAADFSSTTSSIHFSQNQPHESFSERLQRSVLEGVNSHTSTTASKSFESKILPETVRVKAVLSPEAISGVKKLRIHQKSLIDQTNQFGFDCLRRLEHMETRLSGIVSRLTKAFQLAVYKGLNNASFSLNEGIRDVEEGNRLKLNEITKVRKELDVVTKQIAQIQDVILVQRNFIRGKEDFVSKTQQKIRKAEASQQRKKHDFAVTEEDHAKARFRLAKNHLALVEFERNANRVKYLQVRLSSFCLSMS